MRSSVGFHAAVLTALLLVGPPVSAQGRIPQDPSTVRRFNHQSSPTTGRTHHSAAETERDFDFVWRLQLNQAGPLPLSVTARATAPSRSGTVGSKSADS